jgi:hypothetical protein
MDVHIGDEIIIIETKVCSDTIDLYIGSIWSDVGLTWIGGLEPIVSHNWTSSVS